MCRYWLIPILLLVALETRVLAGTVSNAHSVVVARADHHGTQLSPELEHGLSTEEVLKNTEEVPQVLSASLLNWYGSDTVYNVRLVLAGALGFLLVLLGLHLLLPSTSGRPSGKSQSGDCSADSCSCHHCQQVSNGNDPVVQHSMAGANVGNFLPLGISLNHLHAVGQQINGQSSDNEEHYGELTAKVKALEEQLRQVTGNCVADTVDQDNVSRPDLPDVEKPVHSHPNVVGPTGSSAAGNVPNVQKQESLCSRPDSQSQEKSLSDPLFAGLVSETLAVIHSQ